MSSSQAGDKVIRTICDSCMCQCGVLAHVRDGKAVKLEGDPDHPSSQGFMCPMGFSALQTVYHPDRVVYPLKRDGERGGENGDEYHGTRPSMISLNGY